MRRKDYCFYYWPLCQLWSAITGLIRDCCLCRLRSCGGCSQRPHIQLYLLGSLQRLGKAAFLEDPFKGEKVTSSDWKIRSGIFGVGGGTPFPHQLLSPQQRHHSSFTAKTFLNLILNCFHCRQDQQGKPSTPKHLYSPQCQVFIIYCQYRRSIIRTCVLEKCL